VRRGRTSFQMSGSRARRRSDVGGFPFSFLEADGSDAFILHCGERTYRSAADPYVEGTTEDDINAETQRRRDPVGTEDRSRLVV